MAPPQPLRETLPGFAHLLRRFWPYTRTQDGVIAGSSLALLATVGLRLLEPWPLKLVFDGLFPTAPGAAAPGIPVLAGLEPAALLAVAALGLVSLTALRALASYWSTVGFALVGSRVLAEVRHDVYRHLQRLSLSFHTKAKSGDLIVRVMGDVGLLKEVAVTALLPLLGNVLILLGMVAVMLWLHWQLALVALVALPLFWLSTLRAGRRIQEVSRTQRRREGAMAATAAETIGAIKVVQALSLEGLFSQAFARQNQGDLKEGVKAKRLAAGLERTVDVLVAAATALVLWYGARLVSRAELTPGELLVFLTYLRSGFRPVRDFAKYAGRLAKATAAGERVLELLDQTPDVRDVPGAVPAPPFRGAVRFEGVSFAYEPGRPVLEAIDLDVPPGQHVALVGPSGDGKSTLVNLLLRLYDPTQGRVLIDGRDVRAYTLESLRAQIGVVLQDTLLFAASARENIAYGRPDTSAEDVEAAARLANAHGFIQALPHGYDTVLGERGLTLSGGQRQRLAIARAAVRRAPLLILDEPTTGLDEANERAVVDALDRLACGRTTFLVTHDLHHAARADLILYLEDGRLLERGTHAELMRRAGRYADLYRLRATARDRGAPAPPEPPTAPESPKEGSYALAS